METEKGILYLCATPIGNLEDITLRALRVLRRVDLVAAEDTRRTRQLFARYKIKTLLTSYHVHNQQQKGAFLLSLLKVGRKIALVTDAGLPGISDPGHMLVKAALAEGIPVTPLPGPSASLAALVVSGLPTRRFVFEGFLPRAAGERRRRLEALKREPRTIIIYEAPHRLREALADLERVWGHRQIAVVRELTKVHEEVIRGEISQVRKHFEKVTPRGEITLVAAGAPLEEFSAEEKEVQAAVAALLKAGKTKKEVAKEISRRFSVPPRLAYAQALELAQEPKSPPDAN